jgi:hypothetical protein
MPMDSEQLWGNGAGALGRWLSGVALLSACSAGGSGNTPVSAGGGTPPVDPIAVPGNEPPPAPPVPLEGQAVDLIGDSDDGAMGPSTPTFSARRRGLQEKQVSCPGGGTTRVSGTVYIPSGQLPVYNAAVYVPDANLRPLTPGVSCTCEITGEPIATALTDASGHFVLENVPVGSNIPLVVQVGDWRREFDVGTVEACVDNPVPDQTLRLPARQSQGDIPKIAVVTGLLDALECLVRKLGIDESEFTGESGGGRVTLYAGDGGTRGYASLNGGESFPPAESLWNDVESLSRYDVVLMSCDGRQDNMRNKTEQSLEAMFAYLNSGGRVFGSHFQSVWFGLGPEPFPALAQYGTLPDLGDVDAQVVTTFPKGQALSQWLFNAGASPKEGEVLIEAAQHNLVVENPEYAQRWIETTEPVSSVQYISANTPLGVADDAQCGRLVLSDIHVSDSGAGNDNSDSSPSYNFPNGCVTTEFTPQEAILAFMLFDLSGCVVPDDVAPAAPPTILR